MHVEIDHRWWHGIGQLSQAPDELREDIIHPTEGYRALDVVRHATSLSFGCVDSIDLQPYTFDDVKPPHHIRIRSDVCQPAALVGVYVRTMTPKSALAIPH